MRRALVAAFAVALSCVRGARAGGKLRYVEIATIPLVRDPIER
jgi:hypothetical protein